MKSRNKTMRGSGQCPKCGSRKVVRLACPPEIKFYAGEIEVCRNPACGAAWEPYDPEDLLDQHPLSCFKEPCDNCAFRPGSHEQQNSEEWKTMIASLKQNGFAGGFFCHKGVPLEPNGKHGFAYPHDKDGNPIKAKLRACRGWLRMLAKHIDARLEKEKG